jgi:hypothetical protein
VLGSNLGRDVAIFKDLLGLFSLSPDKYWNSIPIMPQTLSSKSLPVNIGLQFKLNIKLKIFQHPARLISGVRPSQKKLNIYFTSLFRT